MQQRSGSKAIVSDLEPYGQDLLSPEVAQRMTELHDLTNVKVDASMILMLNIRYKRIINCNYGHKWMRRKLLRLNVIIKR
jgi:hypothetical protein